MHLLRNKGRSTRGRMILTLRFIRLQAQTAPHQTMHTMYVQKSVLISFSVQLIIYIYFWVTLPLLEILIVTYFSYFGRFSIPDLPLIFLYIGTL